MLNSKIEGNKLTRSFFHQGDKAEAQRTQNISILRLANYQAPFNLLIYHAPTAARLLPWAYSYPTYANTKDIIHLWLDIAYEGLWHIKVGDTAIFAH